MLITYPQLKELFGIPYTPQHILRLQKQGRFPLRRKSGNFNFWLYDDVKRWVESLQAVESAPARE